MAETHNEEQVRMKFPKGAQARFLRNVKERLLATNADLASLLHLSRRTIRDWEREKFLMTTHAVEQLRRRASLPFPKIVELRDPFWYVHIGATRGGRRQYELYGGVGGDPAYRKKKWREWWKRKGQHQDHPILYRPKTFIKPRQSTALAEFIGVMIGDGGISKRQICVTLNRKDDGAYLNIVERQMRNLFSVQPHRRSCEDSLADVLVISRSGLVQFLHAKHGLPIGNKIKQGLDIPRWIKQKRQFRIACMRGLMDTDGGVIHHRYRVKGKLYTYTKLKFTSASPPLLRSVFLLLRDLGISCRVARAREICIDGQKDVQRYFTLVGTSNPKHRLRYVKVNAGRSAGVVNGMVC